MSRDHLTTMRARLQVGYLNPGGHAIAEHRTVQELPPGPIFESRMRSILRDHADRQRPTGISPESVTYEEVQLPDRPVYEWRSANDLIAHQPPPKALTKAESSRLVDLFISQMGIDQHFVDPRAFYDAMILLYKDEQTRNAQMQSIWFIQYLLLMALGMLISSPSTEKGRAPGCSYFAEAMRRLPPTYQLGSHGIISVEILCLITLYLQWRDRKHEAYVHVRFSQTSAITLTDAIDTIDWPGHPSRHRARMHPATRRARRPPLRDLPSHKSLVDCLHA